MDVFWLGYKARTSLIQIGIILRTLWCMVVARMYVMRIRRDHEKLLNCKLFRLA